MIGLVRAELIKLTRRKLYWVMLSIFAAVMAMVAFFILVFPNIQPDAFEGFPAVRKPQAYSFGAAQALGQTWFPVVLAVVVLGGETGTTIWPTTLTMESRRWLHLLVRAVVIAGAAWLATLAAVGGWSAVAAFLAEGSGGLSAAGWLSIVWKTGLVELTWVAFGLGAAALLKSVGPAIGLGLAFGFGEQILALWHPWQEISLSVASTNLMGDFGDLTAGTGIGGIGHMGSSQALAVVIGWTLFGLVMALVGLQVRDP